MISNILKKYHEENRYYKIFATDYLMRKREHVEHVIQLIDTISISDGIDFELLKMCAEHHDDGRCNQYELLGNFNDNIISHNVLSIERFDRFLRSEGYICTPSDEDIQIMRDVMLYHGRINLLTNPSSKKYVEIITALDDLENSTRAVSYLLDEVSTDAKGYVESNPSADQKHVSDFVFSKFSNGEKFDKIKYCTTYGEYVLFAATLVTSCIKKYDDYVKVAMLQPGYGYSSILEGYRDIFSKTLHEDTSKKAYDVLLSML